MGPGLSTELFIIGYSVNTMKSPRFLPATASFRLSEMLMLTAPFLISQSANLAKP